MSLRAFHLAFILLCIMGADLVGLWALRVHSQTHEVGMLVMGIAMFAGGLGLAGYGAHVFGVLERLRQRKIG